MHGLPAIFIKSVQDEACEGLLARWEAGLRKHPKHLAAVVWFRARGYYGDKGLPVTAPQEFQDAMNIKWKRRYGLLKELLAAKLILQTEIVGERVYVLNLAWEPSTQEQPR